MCFELDCGDFLVAGTRRSRTGSKTKNKENQKVRTWSVYGQSLTSIMEERSADVRGRETISHRAGKKEIWLERGRRGGVINHMGEGNRGVGKREPRQRYPGYGQLPYEYVYTLLFAITPRRPDCSAKRNPSDGCKDLLATSRSCGSPRFPKCRVGLLKSREYPCATDFILDNKYYILTDGSHHSGLAWFMTIKLRINPLAVYLP